MTELKACPFCGGRAIMQDRYIQAICNRKHYWVVCSVCESRIHDRKNMTRAITAWNTRAEPDNPPLTEAEIRNERDGKPVWIVWLDGRIKSMWYIVGTVRWLNMDFFDEYKKSDYGISWVAYDHEPKQKQD